MYQTKCECIFLPHNIYSYQKEYYNNKHSTVKILCNYSSLSIIFFPYQQKNFMEHSTHSNMAWMKYYEQSYNIFSGTLSHTYITHTYAILLKKFHVNLLKDVYEFRFNIYLNSTNAMQEFYIYEDFSMHLYKFLHFNI